MHNYNLFLLGILWSGLFLSPCLSWATESTAYNRWLGPSYSVVSNLQENGSCIASLKADPILSVDMISAAAYSETYRAAAEDLPALRRLFSEVKGLYHVRFFEHDQSGREFLAAELTGYLHIFGIREHGIDLSLIAPNRDSRVFVSSNLQLQYELSGSYFWKGERVESPNRLPVFTYHMRFAENDDCKLRSRLEIQSLP